VPGPSRLERKGGSCLMPRNLEPDREGTKESVWLDYLVRRAFRA